MRHSILLSILAACCAAAADPLPGTRPLTLDGPFDAQMVDGLHKYLDREIAASARKRDALWLQRAGEDPAKARDRLGAMLGVSVQYQPSARLKTVGKPLVEESGLVVHAVQWTVKPGLHSEGLMIEPKDGRIAAHVVAIPDASQSSEDIVGFHPEKMDFASRIAAAGCRVLVPVVVGYDSSLSANIRIHRRTNIPHREFIHRMAFEFGQTMTGLEVQTVISAIDGLQELGERPVGVVGYGTGGRTALYAGALDTRIAATHVVCAFGPRESMHEEPLDRALFGVLNEFGDAEVARMYGERKFRFTPRADLGSELREDLWPKYGRFTLERDGQKAPGELRAIPTALASAEWKRSGRKLPADDRDNDSTTKRPWIVHDLGIPQREQEEVKFKPFVNPDIAARNLRQVRQHIEFCQKLYHESHLNRRDFWEKADLSKATPETWDRTADWYRDHFHAEIIGKLPEPTIPLNPRTRQVYDEKEFIGYEVMLDVYDEVFAYGILLLPRNLKEGEKRPVVVCQHGLNGTPRDCIDAGKGERAYHRFAWELVRKGYIVYCPQNPYVTENNFRQVQRKAYALKLTLYSFIIRQHQRTLDWLETLPNVDPKRIGFYGLSYGGKTAMRVPAIEKRYCLSICSGDFNDWIGKMVRLDIPMSYMFTHEYEMYEWNLGNTFNYAEMAYLIAPRPFMVERGHDDGVGIDEMVASEYAKVRYFYNNRLRIPDRTAIEFNIGGHEIFLKGTLKFLEDHLGKPAASR